MMTLVNSRSDLEALRGTPAFADVLLLIYGSMTKWSLGEGEWIASEDLSLVNRFGYSKSEFLAEIAPFDFPAPEAPPTPELPPVVFPHLSARQLRLGLIAAGVSLSSVDAAIAAIPDEADREVAQVEWQFASQFERDHPLIEQVGAALGLEPWQIDAAWLAALDI